MKITSTILVFLFLVSGVTCQEQLIQAYRRCPMPIKQDILNGATEMIDVNPNYPGFMISESDYISTEILAYHMGERLSAEGINENLSESQSSLLKQVDPGSAISFQVKYYAENGATRKPDLHTMKFVATVLPATEAEYPGGKSGLAVYLRELITDQLPALALEELRDLSVSFTITNTGEVNDVFATAADNTELKKLLSDSISKMPVWSPAKDNNGNPVSQRFTYQIGVTLVADNCC